MSKNISFMGVLLSLVLFLFIGLYFGQKSILPLGPDAYASCAVSMDHVLDSGKGDVYNFSGVTNFEEPAFYYLASYDVE
ncbi:MAG TPA: hypothetical protein PKE23_04870, partial [Anaerolineales bacterium]|nr:hypothetical protein [Anaerolineales bacterium]